MAMSLIDHLRRSRPGAGGAARRPLLMGILNVTPDSFSDGGRFLEPEAAVARARAMVAAGADIIDVGGESTRPGAEPVPVEEELRRVIPVIETLAGEIDVPLSVDTSKPEVMRAAAEAGAGMINDVHALRRPGALEAAAETGLPVCLMHMRGEPADMQADPRYDDVVGEVREFLRRRIEACRGAGIGVERLVVDPGFGFGKTLEHNLTLLAGLEAFAALGCPVLVGVSRKRMFEQLYGAPVDRRLAGSLAAAVMALERGAAILRVHDVAAHAEALAVWRAVEDAGNAD